ncbi:putative nuclease HARBI1 [Gastrophryne carolinensis]
MTLWAKRRCLLGLMQYVAEKEIEEEKSGKKRKKCWIKPKLPHRDTYGSHMGLLGELPANNPEELRNYLRMSDESFQKLLLAVKPLIQRQDTVMRESISAEQRLLATLRYLATGRSLQDLKFTTAISAPMLSRIIPETCEAIITALRDEYLKFPSSTEEWQRIAEDFELQWHFPNCGGALVGKHVRIMQPANSGTFYYNYKGYFSIIFIALVNANYEFIMVDVGRNGRVSDGGILEKTKFFSLLQSNDLCLPTNDTTKENMNYVFVGDEAFPLHKHLMKPYPQKSLTPERKICNYRLARARHVVENAFGIMANRFRVFHTAINLRPQSIDKVVMACCVLHNFLRKNDATTYSPESMIDSENLSTSQVTLGEWRSESDAIASLAPAVVRHASEDAINCREKYCRYFNGTGSVSWQEHMIYMTMIFQKTCSDIQTSPKKNLYCPLTKEQSPESSESLKISLKSSKGPLLIPPNLEKSEYDRMLEYD